MKQTEERIALLRQMAQIARSRKAAWDMTEYQAKQTVLGAEALEAAAEALQVMICA